MTHLGRSLLTGALVALVLPVGLRAQDAPLPPASPRPTAPASTVAPAVPPSNAVALCNDLSYVVTPAAPSACATRGGLKLVLPANRPNAPQTVAPGSGPAALQAAPTPRSDVPPAGATMRCKDGTWLSGTAVASRCAGNGGLAAILPPPRATAPQPQP